MWMLYNEVLTDITLQATHWLVDRRGYGVTLAVVNVLGVLCCIFQVDTVDSNFSTSCHMVIADCTWPPVQALDVSCALPAGASTCCGCTCDQFDLFETQRAPRMQPVPSLPTQALTLVLNVTQTLQSKP